MTNSQKNQEEVILMDYDVVYHVAGKQIIQTRRRVITDGVNQAVMIVYSEEYTKTEQQSFPGKIYPLFKDEEGKKYEGFLPANGLFVEMHSKERFDMLVKQIMDDKNQ